MTEPYPFQRRGIRKIQKKFRGRALLADDMGLGKTPQALWWSKDHLGHGAVVILCPATIKENWRREAARHAHMRAEVLYGRRPPWRGTLPKSTDDVYIINYEILGPVQRRSTKTRRRSWGNFLKDLRPRLIIIDECQYIKSRTAQRTRRVRELCRGVPHVIALGGTGAMNSRPAEMWPVLNILRPDVFNSFPDFGLEFCGAVRRPWGWEYKGATALKKLYRKLRRVCMVRRRKAAVLGELPPKTRSVVPMTLAPADRREYEEAAYDFLNWLQKTMPALARKAAKAEELSRMGHLKRLAGRAKLAGVIRWVEDFLSESGEKLIVYGLHKKVLRPLRDHFGRRCELVDGTITGRRRQAALDRFNHDKACRVLFGNIQAAGVGWNCTCTSYTAFAELGWTPGEHVQAEDRCHGIGRGTAKPVHAYYLVAENTIEEYLCELIQRKQLVLEQILDGRKVRGVDIFEQLKKALQSRGRTLSRRGRR